MTGTFPRADIAEQALESPQPRQSSDQARATVSQGTNDPVPLDAWDLTRSWGKGDSRVCVIEHLELTLEPGSLTWIGGANGVGKTTLLRVIAGLISPTAGHVRVFGSHAERDRRAYQQRLAFLSASSTGLYARLTVRKQIDYWARIAFVPIAQRSEAVEKVIYDFSLESLSDRRLDRLSMGQRQRVRLGMTFVKEPDLVLLDEPRNSLDTEGAAMLVAAIRRVCERGGAVLWCSPLGEPLGLRFDRRLVLEDRKLRPS
jgi:ABC-2 type transport system ATP-binding protein